MYVCMNLQNYKEKLVLKKVYKKGQSGYFVSSFSDIKKLQEWMKKKFLFLVVNFLIMIAN